MSVAHAKEIMSLTLDQDNPHFGKILSAKTAIQSSVFSTQARVDETMLRAKQGDKMEKLIDMLREERARLGAPSGQTLELDGEEILVMPQTH